jgi:hypothetical protein
MEQPDYPLDNLEFVPMSSLHPFHTLACIGTGSSAALKSCLLHEWEKGFGFGIGVEHVERWFTQHPTSASCKFASRLACGGAFVLAVAQMKELTSGMVDGFSPKQLIDQTALRTLPSELRDRLGSAVHDRYLAVTRIVDFQSALSKAVNALETAILDFGDTWRTENRSNVERVRRSYTTLLDAARVVRDLLTRLPRGIVLP